MDDFYIVVTREQLPRATSDIEVIERYLKRLGLVLHPDKRRIQPAKHGVPFLGAVVYKNVVYPGKRLKRNVRKAFYKYAQGRGDEAALTSYVGHLKYMKHYKFLCETCEGVGLERTFWQRFSGPNLGEVEC